MSYQLPLDDDVDPDNLEPTENNELNETKVNRTIVIKKRVVKKKKKKKKKKVGGVTIMEETMMIDEDEEGDEDASELKGADSVTPSLNNMLSKNLGKESSKNVSEAESTEPLVSGL